MTSSLKEQPQAADARRPRLRLGGMALLWPVLALAALLLFNLCFTPNFFHLEIRDGKLVGSLVDVLNRGVPVVLLALGMTLVVATGGIDLSVGAVMAIAGATAACLVARPDDSPLSIINIHGSLALALLISLGAALLCGLWNGALVALVEVQPIVATLILMVTGRGLAQLITAGQIPTFTDPALCFVGGGTFLGLPFSVTIAAAAFLVIALLTRQTALGLFIEAVGDNATTSRYCGINARLVKLAAYGCSGILAGVAGIIATSNIRGADANNLGLNLELDAVLAVAIGGTNLNGGRFHLVGSVIGALVIQTLTTTILALGVPPATTLVVKGVVVIALCLLQSEQFRKKISIRSRRAA